MTDHSPQRLRRTWSMLAALTLIGVGVDVGCAPENSAGDALSDEARAALQGMLTDAWTEVISIHLDAARASTESLASAITTWSEAPTSSQARAEAQAAWYDALSAWQETEVMQVGPAGDSLTVVGGEDLRDEIYSWPLTNPCMVDQRTVRGEYSDDGFFDDVLVNSTGFDALSPAVLRAKHPRLPISGPGRSRLGGPGGRGHRAGPRGLRRGLDPSDHRQHRRHRYPLGPGLCGRPRDGGRRRLILRDTAGGCKRPLRRALLPRDPTKDRSWDGLGITECGEDSCVDQIETLLAGGSQTWLTSNLSGFRALFTGGEGTGMDDLLAAVGREDLAREVIVALDDADAAVADLDAPLDTVDAAKLTAAHTAVKTVADLLKSDVATVLTLQVPSEAAGDND